jgi:TRAP-type C4-dicarboxylate transport system substrate-binding protein
VQVKLRAIAEDAGRELTAKVQQMNADAIDQMKAQGLIIDQPSNVGAWRKLAQQAWTSIRGKVVSTALFDQIKQLVEEYRAQHP